MDDAAPARPDRRQFQRRANIVACYTILALHFIECHAAGEAAYHDGNRQRVPRITGLP